jgi:hypothetical protein
MPEWNKRGHESLGRDPLGIQATSIAIYRRLVPGLTNVTNRLRYYSYYCWVVRDYEQRVHSDDPARWQRHIRRAEALYAIASEVDTPNQTNNLAGVDWARSYLAENPTGRIDLATHTDFPANGPRQYLQAKRGNFGQFYVASMFDVGFLEEPGRIPLVTRGRGVSLAAAFAEAVGPEIEAALARAITTGNVSRQSVAAIGKAVHPSAINPGTAEMQQLRAFALATTPDRDGSTARLSTAWLLLDLLRRGVDIDDTHGLRRALYHRVLPDDQPYTIGGSTIDAWRAYQANELCHIALEAWLNAMAQRIGDATDGVAPHSLIAGLLESALDEDSRSANWAAWAELCAGKGMEHEEECSTRVHEAIVRPPEAPDPDVLRAAAELLAILWSKFRLGQHGVRATIKLRARGGGRSLDSVFDSLDARCEATTADALGRAIYDSIVIQHLEIAGVKLTLSGTFTYRFGVCDGKLHDGIVAKYEYTTPRLPNLARFLSDARLRMAEKVTKAGEKFLNAHQPA